MVELATEEALKALAALFVIALGIYYLPWWATVIVFAAAVVLFALTYLARERSSGS